MKATICGKNCKKVTIYLFVTMEMFTFAAEIN